LKGVQCTALAYHPQDGSTLVRHGRILEQWSSASSIRLFLTGCFALAVVLILTGQIAEESFSIKLVALIANGFALFVVFVAPSHFLEVHLWKHVVRRHAVRILLWTLGALIVAHIVLDVFHLDTLSPGGRWAMLAAACLVRMVPQSGPHLVFVTLFAQGAILFSILLANSIVQDGHGILPLLAESRRAFIVVKAINVAAGALIGVAALAMGF